VAIANRHDLVLGGTIFLRKELFGYFVCAAQKPNDTQFQRKSQTL